MKSIGSKNYGAIIHFIFGTSLAAVILVGTSLAAGTVRASVRGSKDLAHYAKIAGKDTAHAVDRSAVKTGKFIGRAGQDTGQGIGIGFKHTGQGVAQAMKVSAKETGAFFRKAGRIIY